MNKGYIRATNGSYIRYIEATFATRSQTKRYTTPQHPKGCGGCSFVVLGCQDGNNALQLYSSPVKSV